MRAPHSSERMHVKEVSNDKETPIKHNATQLALKPCHNATLFSIRFYPFGPPVPSHTMVLIIFQTMGNIEGELTRMNLWMRIGNRFERMLKNCDA